MTAVNTIDLVKENFRNEILPNYILDDRFVSYCKKDNCSTISPESQTNLKQLKCAYF